MSAVAETKKVKASPEAQQAAKEAKLKARLERKEKAKSDKVKRAPYLADGAPKLKEVPTDFNPKTHFLRKADFENEYTFLELKARQAEEVAASYRKQAEELRVLGDSKDRVKLKRLKKLTSDLEALTKSLSDDGVDVKAFLEALRKG